MKRRFVAFTAFAVWFSALYGCAFSGVDYGDFLAVPKMSFVLAADEERAYVQLACHRRPAAEKALVLEGLQALGHRRRRPQSNSVPDLPGARHVPVGSHPVADRGEDELVARGQRGGVEAPEHVAVVVVGHRGIVWSGPTIDIVGLLGYGRRLRRLNRPG